MAFSFNFIVFISSRQALIVTPDGRRKVEWRDVRVGDILELHRDELVPADIVLLGTSLPSGLVSLRVVKF